MANDINTTSLDLPPALASILNMQLPTVQQPAQAAPMVGLSSAAGIGPQQIGGGMSMSIPSFQEGGYIGDNRIPNPVRSLNALVNLPGQLMSLKRARDAGPKPNIPLSESGYGNDPFNMGPAGFYAAGRQEQAMNKAGGMALGNQYQGYLDNMINPPRGGGIARDERLGDQSLSMDIPSFQEGGMIGEGGMPVPPGAVPGMPMPMAGVNPAMDSETPMDAQAMQMQINQVASRHPEAMAEIRNAIVEEMQSGDLTQQELNMIVQLAQLAANNPEMYPYVKQFAMQQGIAAAGDLPEQYDQGLVMVLLLAARAVQQDLGGAPAGEMPANAGPVIPSMQKGGMLPASGKSEPILIEAHTGEYVIPKHVVDMKGKEFFDSLVEKYKDKK